MFTLPNKERSTTLCVWLTDISGFLIFSVRCFISLTLFTVHKQSPLSLAENKIHGKQSKDFWTSQSQIQSFFGMYLLKSVAFWKHDSHLSLIHILSSVLQKSNNVYTLKYTFWFINLLSVKEPYSHSDFGHKFWNGTFRFVEVSQSQPVSYTHLCNGTSGDIMSAPCITRNVGVSTPAVSSDTQQTKAVGKQHQ